MPVRTRQSNDFNLLIIYLGQQVDVALTLGRSMTVCHIRAITLPQVRKVHLETKAAELVRTRYEELDSAFVRMSNSMNRLNAVSGYLKLIVGLGIAVSEVRLSLSPTLP